MARLDGQQYNSSELETWMYCECHRPAVEWLWKVGCVPEDMSHNPARRSGIVHLLVKYLLRFDVVPIAFSNGGSEMSNPAGLQVSISGITFVMTPLSVMP